MAKKDPIKKRKNTVTRVGSTTKGGRTALAFKKGTKNHTTVAVKKTRPNRTSPLNTNDRKKVPADKRQVGETIPQYLRRKRK